MAGDAADRSFLWADELTPLHLAIVDRNWRACNAELDRLLALAEEHREAHCDKWYCGSPELAELLSSFNQADTAMMLRAAMERILDAERAGRPPR